MAMPCTSDYDAGYLGKPTDAIMPEVFLAGQSESVGHIITIMNKLPMYSETPEMLHMVIATLIRHNATVMLCNIFLTYHQKHSHFRISLRRLFKGVAGRSIRLCAGRCRLVFEAYSQKDLCA